ncbi:YqaA family protein [Desulfosediminicola sp.]|uniref:YqaA family protein n=1 Tax=Desulfosediminicola sp. TaxID=2886825 RepID=UPI003AF2D4F6
MEFLAQYGYLGLFSSAFLAATLLPLSSEVVLSVLLYNELSPMLLVIVATLGNVLGSVVNYGMGLGGGKLFKKKFSTASEKEVNAALSRFEKYGTYSLLFAWVPGIGDPLTVAAGVLRVNFILFLLLVTAGKLGRYIVLSYLVLKNMPS